MAATDCMSRHLGRSRWRRWHRRPNPRETELFLPEIRKN